MVPEQKRDYYEVLGLKKGAGDDEIKKAYRKLAKQNHPDVNPGNAAAETRFKEVSEAYEVLSDSSKRQRYDQFGHAGVDPSYGAGQYGGNGGFSEEFDLGSIFESFFGGGFGGNASRQNAPQRGENLRASVILSFEEAAFACEKEISVSRVESCTHCSGTGAAAGTSADPCQTCGGSGQVRQTQRTVLGVVSTTAACSVCGGSGRVIKTPCQPCRGSGNVRKNRKITVKLPAGIDEGQVVSVKGQGGVGRNGGPPGDVLVRVQVRPHPIFTREGMNIYCDIPLTFVQAALGAEIDIPTLESRQRYAVPEGTQSGTTVRFKGRGIVNINGRGKGDEYVRFNVEVPRNLSELQKEKLRGFGESLKDSNNTQHKSFFDKLKDSFNK